MDGNNPKCQHTRDLIPGKKEIRKSIASEYQPGSGCRKRETGAGGSIATFFSNHPFQGGSDMAAKKKAAKKAAPKKVAKKKK